MVGNWYNLDYSLLPNGLGLFTKVVIQDAKTRTTKIANHSQTVSNFDILAKHDELTLALHSMKISDG